LRCGSQNLILNIIDSKIWGQKELEEDAKKPGAKKNKKPKKYVPACYAIVLALAKAPNVKEVEMIGTIAEPVEWSEKLAILRDRVNVVWQAPDTEICLHKVRPPPTPPPQSNEEPAKRAARRK
jgi:hypothetical protein